MNWKGSPPLARERRVRSLSYFLLTGITPAGAGKTQLVENFLLFHRDHPRWRGKDVFATQIPLVMAGSPPLARERLGQKLVVIIGNGITPAGAGKTFCGRSDVRMRRDHPRWRGKD